MERDKPWGDAIQALLDQSPADFSYGGIPYKNLIGALIEAPRVYDALSVGDYRAAGQVVLDFAQDALFDAALEQLGLASISAPAQAAAWPINAGLTAFANAVKQDAFNRQCRLYFAARNAGNSYDAIVSASAHGGLLDADPTIVSQGFLTETDDGWLYASAGAYLPNTVPGYTAPQFYQFAETLYQCQLARSAFPSDRSNLRQAFLSDAFPHAPTIYQQPHGSSYAQGASLLLIVGASGQQPLRYQWFHNGLAIASATTSSYRVQSPEVGDYFVQVIDANSLTTSSETVTVDLMPTGASVVISAPANNATVSGTALVRVTAPAATRVQFYLDGVLQVTDASPPFSWPWNTATADNGQRTLSAKAYNGSTLLGTSAGVQVTVNNAQSGSCLDTNEPNNSSLSATLLPLGSTNTGYLCTPSDVDWFRIPVGQAGMLTVTLSVPVGKDFDLELYGPDTLWVAGSYNPAGQNERVDFPAIEAGTYYARTYGYPAGSGSFSTDQPYQIAASLGAPVATGTASGTITNAVIWSGVVELTGDVTIVGGGSLTIMPGTQVRCMGGDDRVSGNDSSRVEIIVNGGTLDASGTSDALIRFTSRAQSPLPGNWYGLRVVEGDLTLRNCVVEYAMDGIRFEDSDTRFNNYALGNVTVQRCSNRGVYVTSGQNALVTLNNFTVWTNAVGIQNDGGPLTLVGGLVTGNSGNGISCGPLTATDTTVRQNGGWGIIGGNMTLSGCVVSQNGSGGIGGGTMLLSGCLVSQNNGTGVSGSGGVLSECMVTGNHGDGVYANSTLQMNGCTLLRNNGWGLNASPYGTTPVEVWHSLVQSNGSGGVYFGYGALVGLVSNTISGNLGNGVNLSMSSGNACCWTSWTGGMGPSGVTGNVITGNGGVGVEVNGNQPAVLTLAGNDIYQNTNFELRNDSGIAIVVSDEYWGEPTTSEITAGQVNLSRIFDLQDNPSYGQVLIQSIRTTPALQAPRFTTQPQSVTALPGESVSLLAAAVGSEPIAYQWYRNGSPLAQATNTDLALTAIDASQGGSYRAVAINAAGRATSAVAQVFVILPPAAPTIVQHPVSQTASLGSSVSFAVAATGTGPFTYQWKKNGAPIPGANAATLSISSVLVTDAAEYTVTVSNPGGNSTSQPATLTVDTLGGTAVRRQITRYGTNFFITVTVVPPVGTPAYLVEEFLPTGFTVQDISSLGSLDAPNARITWGPFWDGLTRALTYTLLPSTNFTGTATLNGTAFFFGATASTSGDDTIRMIPSNPTSLGISQFYGYYMITINGAVGSSYRLEVGSGIAGPWEPLAIVTLTRNPWAYVDWESGGQTNRFYRTVLLE